MSGVDRAGVEARRGIFHQRTWAKVRLIPLQPPAILSQRSHLEEIHQIGLVHSRIDETNKRVDKRVDSRFAWLIIAAIKL